MNFDHQQDDTGGIVRVLVQTVFLAAGVVLLLRGLPFILTFLFQ